ncbi:DUF1592 domain-containing protein [Luteolibacter sp. LG18]|uniref:DUF1592 domain-containing protein n=1 Tax=Luteolibacter sp. LG18 TaxID=2819286 RepID=UPI002B3102ED|nr:filamin [Luteolibacter sp. LG18]
MDRRISGSILSLGLGLAGGWLAWPVTRASGEPVASVPAAKPAVDQTARYKKEIEPLLVTYCYDCHGDGSHKGELAIDSFKDIAAMQGNREVWKRIREHIGYKLMPPADEDQPDDKERKQLLSWIDDAVFPVDPARPDPGRIPLRRLNREEYRNTIQDLLGVEVAVENVLPPDDSGYGFDNIGDVLTLSPVHIERYLAAARQALDKAVHPDPMPRPERKIAGATMDGPGLRSEDGHYLWKAGEATCHPYFTAGRYKLKVVAAGTWGGNDPPKMELRLDGNLVSTWDVKNPMDSPKWYTAEVKIEAKGEHRIGVTFPNDFWDESIKDPARRDRNLMVNRVEIEGPLDGPLPPKPETHRAIYGERRSGEDDKAYALGVLSKFARHAFRRSPHPGEVERYLRFVDVAGSQGQGIEHGIRLALEAMLVSPSFLFREEPVQGGGRADKIVQLGEHALASRLSYFLWSSMPDDRLLDLADAGQLRKHLDEEITRMIGSPKSERFISNFGGQWLQLRNLASASPDEKRFPNYNRAIGRDMRKETELFLSDTLHSNQPITTLLDADYSFLNGNLARFYGIPGVDGKEFRKVSLAGTPRRGLMGQGAVLIVTSYPTRTSPVLRGKYVLQNLLDLTPPPPPPNIPQLGGNHGQNLTLREQMEIHRKDPSCANCHALMDPIGFAYEQYDAVGSFRNDDRGNPINTAGKLSDGTAFTTVDELRALILTKHGGEFQRALASKLLTYALGRGTDWYDRPAIDAITAKAAKDNGRFQTFIRAVIDSVPFQYRRSS